MQDIAANLARVRERIAAAAAQAGRQANDVKLIAVSKTHPEAAVAAALRAGQLVFGESVAQEALTKIPQFQARDLEWHFIGHVQSNKARFIPGNFQWLQSLDSLKLAERLARLAQTQATRLNALIEVNITRDPKKHGIAANDLFPLIEQLLKAELPAISIRGLMTIGPYPATEHDMRAAFAALRQLRDQCQSRYALPDFTELSMGMSGDYEPAIKEGSTMVRIGTAIFGERDYGA
ncbi:MAG TPA: YggS family pyridoxal phosphate-dependent enzyme [Burkholderiaceae bacterium]|nr:YggS family pyridoxal phosphate-dependent enzyme [Burkholderiaceae bacterium]